MLWRKPRQCVQCGFYSKRGDKIRNHFVCYSCEMQLVEEMATEHEDREYAEIARISNQRFDDGYRS